jgi:DNA polymerase-3 subunit delta
MKVASAKINSTILSLPPSTRVVLLYGSDYGLVDERANILKANFLGKQYDESQFIQIFENQIKENPSIITEQAYSISLFGENKKFIVVREAKDSISKKLSEYIENPDNETLLVLKAQELTPSSSLRKLCENSYDSVLAIPCYVDNAISLRQTILERLKKDGISINPDALVLMVNSLGNDRGITNSELEKIVLYAYNTKNIASLDVENLIDNNSLTALDKFVYACFDLNTNSAYEMINNILEDNNPINVVRALSNHVQKLLLVKALCDQPISIDMALKEIKPPVFFSFVDSFKRQVSTWSTLKLQKLIDKLLYLEIELKTNSNIGNIIIKDLVIKQFSKK